MSHPPNHDSYGGAYPQQPPYYSNTGADNRTNQTTDAVVTGRAKIHWNISSNSSPQDSERQDGGGQHGDEKEKKEYVCDFDGCGKVVRTHQLQNPTLVRANPCVPIVPSTV